MECYILTIFSIVMCCGLNMLSVLNVYLDRILFVIAEVEGTVLVVNRRRITQPFVTSQVETRQAIKQQRNPTKRRKHLHT